MNIVYMWDGTDLYLILHQESWEIQKSLLHVKSEIQDTEKRHCYVDKTVIVDGNLTWLMIDDLNIWLKFC